METTTDKLIEKVIEKGLKLPYYDYGYMAFISEYPVNDGNPPVGIERSDMHNSFREACEYLINND